MSLSIKAKVTGKEALTSANVEFIISSYGDLPGVEIYFGGKTYIVDRREIFLAAVAVCGDITDGIEAAEPPPKPAA